MSGQGDERGPVVVISAYHDYRTAKRASIQQVTDGLARRGHRVTFVSTRFSRLSRRTGDSRLFLWDRVNQLERVGDVDCYLWRTAFHPFASRFAPLNVIMNAAFALYARLGDPVIDARVREARYIVLESSVAAIMLRRLRRMNPTARIIYYATDRLDTVGAHPFVRRRLVADAALIDHVCLRSAGMVEDFAWARGKLFKAEFGVDRAMFATIGPSPYPAGARTAVSVGSMLFDASFFVLAAPRFPDMTFHVIGAGERFEAPSNVIQHDEMPFRDTLPYLARATIGLAPYRAAPGVEYLAESSLKLAQFGYFAIPAACPNFAVGGEPGRHGYEPGDPASITRATEHALKQVGALRPREFPTWDQVAERVLHPENYPLLALG